MTSIYQNIVQAARAGTRMLAVLIDPEKAQTTKLPSIFAKINTSSITHILVGGSTDKDKKTAKLVTTIRQLTKLPVLLFPGDYSQITEKADGVLFLSLLSGRNPEYLIEQHVNSVDLIKNTKLAIIPTGYLLIDGNSDTAVARVSKTKPMDQKELELIANTALAGQYLGKQLIYLEAGSGAVTPVNPTVIATVKSEITIPLIVGGGIRTRQQLENAYKAGADMVVIGTAFEENEDFFTNLKQ